MNQNKKDPCPVCETKKELLSMEMSPEILEEMAEQENFADSLDDAAYRKRLSICNACKYLQNGITCAHCGCFVQLRAKHSTAHCVMEKW